MPKIYTLFNEMIQLSYFELMAEMTPINTLIQGIYI